jgi:moderate conductance mechanosensitive channel
VPIKPESARPISRLFGLTFGLGMLGPTLLPLLIKNGMAQDAARCLGLFFAVIVTVSALKAMRTMAQALIEPVSDMTRHIVTNATSFAVLVLGSTWAWSIVAGEFRLFWALLSSVGILAVFVTIDVLLSLEATEARSRQMRVVRGIVRFAAGVIAALWMGHIWFASTGALPWAQWPSVSLAILSGGATLFVGYLIWEITNFWAEKALGINRVIDPLQVDDDEMLAPSSRLATFFPMARVLIGFMILLIAVMVALSDLGVNVAPLLAGAGVFGLAISFGSQSLIKDILSGVFFMADDAFRVGEYIDTGRLKGTVEKISLRSLRLRHQNGQVHTIPYGQLQSITNFSRDWATMKFTLRIDPSSDLELVRKTVKKVGIAMMDDPELGKEILQPVKLQGVQEIQDNALVVRIKFTARPNKPTWVQREALKRIILAFRENGIKFAANAVTIAGGPQNSTSAEMAAAAAAGITTSAGPRFPTMPA